MLPGSMGPKLDTRGRPGSSGTRVKVPLWKVNPLTVSAAPDTETAEVGMRAKEKGRTQN